MIHNISKVHPNLHVGASSILKLHSSFPDSSTHFLFLRNLFTLVVIAFITESTHSMVKHVDKLLIRGGKDLPEVHKPFLKRFSFSFIFQDLSMTHPSWPMEDPSMIHLWCAHDDKKVPLAYKFHGKPLAHPLSYTCPFDLFFLSKYVCFFFFFVGGRKGLMLSRD